MFDDSASHPPQPVPPSLSEATAEPIGGNPDSSRADQEGRTHERLTREQDPPDGGPSSSPATAKPGGLEADLEGSLHRIALHARP